MKAILAIVESDLLAVVRKPCVRQNCVKWRVLIVEELEVNVVEIFKV